MTDSLQTSAEKKAQEAEKLQAFSGLNLLHIRREVTKLLSLIGREGIFDEYTSHDISHIDKMLNMLEWIVPDITKSIMSPADWLMTVLAIYFHDLGMLVTKREYDNRNNSSFSLYCNEELFKGDFGSDYRAKVDQIEPERAERFLYQEFVRHKHAERIRNWISGVAREHLGISHEAILAINELLKPFNKLFRRDLALICESHHLDDLNNFNKYQVSQPYGDSDAETVNLQYCAVLLRTVDLLHMTSDRTPSIVFKTINPTDPISQEEWAKQSAVNRVRPKVGVNREGVLDPDVPRDTIEIHAYFNKKDGFFGLTSYLNYVEEQIRKSYDWIETANKHKGALHKFPWRFIDDQNIQTEGFIPETFEFTFDQAKILDLLTGHTLYNDTDVVLRELVQNSIDAIRVQHLINKQSAPGKIEISWDSNNRVLSVKDNGTGMTQDIVEQNLLKVGASRYQNSEFKKQYPEFAPISRFGIGLLSAFMIADEVEILTYHPEEDKARQLSLRSVHGKYLIQLIDKQNNDLAKQLMPHGTSIKLSVRQSAEIENIIEIARKWIVFPNCEVTVKVDEQEPIKIGFNSPKEALIDLLENSGISVEIDRQSSVAERKVKIKEEEIDGVTIAYAVEWSDSLREWSFLSVDSIHTPNENIFILGVCIEGIRVVFETPGFKSKKVVAMANATGKNAPKTNVARSGFELTPERSTMLKAIYSVYCNHIKTELQELHQKRQFSLTWAVQESKYLLAPILNSSRNDFDIKSLDYKLLIDIIKKIPLLLVEKNGERQAISLAEVELEKFFWTIDCQFFHSAESLISQIPSQTSLSQLISAFHIENNFEIPNDPILCGFNFNNILNETLLEKREIDTIKLSKAQRRIDCRWNKKGEKQYWYHPQNLDLSIDKWIESFSKLGDKTGRLRLYNEMREEISFESESLIINNIYTRNSSPDFYIGKEAEVIGNENEIAARIYGNTYIYPHTYLGQYLVDWIDKILESESENNSRFLVLIMYDIINSLFNINRKEKYFIVSDELVQNIIESTRFSGLIDRDSRKLIEKYIQKSDFYDLIRKTNWEIFDLSVYDRKKDVGF